MSTTPEETWFQLVKNVLSSMENQNLQVLEQETLSKLRIAEPPQILGVEDDPVQQLILDKVVQGIQPGLKVTWATNAEEARVLLDKLDFQLILADISLGHGATGMDLWEGEKIRNRETPFLFVTSLGYDRFLKALGPYDVTPPFLTKPIFPGEAAQMIGSLLNIEPLEKA